MQVFIRMDIECILVPALHIFGIDDRGGEIVVNRKARCSLQKLGLSLGEQLHACIVVRRIGLIHVVHKFLVFIACNIQRRAGCPHLQEGLRVGKIPDPRFMRQRKRSCVRSVCDTIIV